MVRKWIRKCGSAGGKMKRKRVVAKAKYSRDERGGNGGVEVGCGPRDGS